MSIGSTNISFGELFNTALDENASIQRYPLIADKDNYTSKHGNAYWDSTQDGLVHLDGNGDYIVMENSSF